jgi:hypothetical protein
MHIFLQIATELFASFNDKGGVGSGGGEASGWAPLTGADAGARLSMAEADQLAQAGHKSPVAPPPTARSIFPETWLWVDASTKCVPLKTLVAKNSRPVFHGCLHIVSQYRGLTNSNKIFLFEHIYRASEYSCVRWRLCRRAAYGTGTGRSGVAKPCSTASITGPGNFHYDWS